MATEEAVKEALGLPSNASDAKVKQAIAKLQADAKRAEEAEAKAKTAMETVNARSEAPEVAADIHSEPGEGQVRTRRGIEDTVEKRVKVLSCFWYTLEPSPIVPGNYIEVEHRATRNQVVQIPESVAARYSEPDIDAFYRHLDPQEEFNEPGNYEFSKMSEADLINWHRATKPDVKTIVEAAAGEPDIARRLIAAESTATQGDPREEVISALAEVVARGNL